MVYTTVLGSTKVVGELINKYQLTLLHSDVVKRLADGIVASDSRQGRLSDPYIVGSE